MGMSSTAVRKFNKTAISNKIAQKNKRNPLINQLCCIINKLYKIGLLIKVQCLILALSKIQDCHSN